MAFAGFADEGPDPHDAANSKTTAVVVTAYASGYLFTVYSPR